ncbi:MAG: polysaccharide biosynthesis C-terminal domain-containing protein [Firmicutes bacterium]|nr:polysaccharide biosynthesis C-terminal domain-containing protein [Bacillota bacterium]
MDLNRDNINLLFKKFLIPSVSGAIAIAIYSLIDSIAIGQGVGVNGAAACAVTLPLFSVGNFISLVFGVGGSVLMSVARGEGKKEKGDAFFMLSCIGAAAVVAVVWVLEIIFQENIYRFFGCDDVIMPYAIGYGKWIIYFLPCLVLPGFLSCFVRNDGSPKMVMKIIMTGGVINIIGDWLLVFPLDMGIEGAAIATAAGLVVQSVLMVMYLLSDKCTLSFAKPYKVGKKIKQICSVGFSAGLSKLSVIVVTFAANNQIMRYLDASALAVYGVLATISSLSISIFTGIGQASQPIVASNYGAGQKDRYWQVFFLALKTTAAFGVACMVLCFAFPVPLATLFIRATDEIVAIAPYITRVYALSFVPMGMCVLAVLYFQSVMEPSKATKVSLTRSLVMNTALLYALPFVFGGNGIWWAFLMSETIAFALAVIYVKKLYKDYKMSA